MLDRLEMVEGLSADALGGGIGGDPIGMCGLEFAEFAQKEIVVAIGDGWAGLLIIALVMRGDFAAQLVESLEGVHQCDP